MMSLHQLGRHFTKLNASNPSFLCNRHVQILRKVPLQKSIHTSSTRFGLNEFFDDPKNIGQKQVKVGRSWRIEELRMKSNSDLHKLWYVLLKEKNMLMTMEHESKDQFMDFPNPERYDKVEESMENLEDVIRERNLAYFQLETTITGERPAEVITNAFGLKELYQKKEYDRPKEVNTEWQKEQLDLPIFSRAVQKFKRLLKEKIARKNFVKLQREKKEVEHILSTYKDVDIEAVKIKYPNIDVEAVKVSDKARGNWAP